MELRFEIAAPDLPVTYPELHHYTDLAGLTGIVKNQTIWATHFSNLNDSTEVTLLQQPMIDILVERACASIEKSNRNARRRFETAGGRAKVQEATTDFVSALFGAAFNSKKIMPLAEPYIASFCGHGENQSYETENGLLSQWRAYGGNDRYCLVFDTIRMINLLVGEFDRHYWVYMRLASVHYATPSAAIETLFPDLIEASEADLIKALNGSPVTIAERTMTEFLAAAPRYKHQGFWEEQEIRIIAIPGKQHALDRIRIEHPEETFGPTKSIRKRGGRIGEYEYVALFDELGTTLPIKRVIIGPSQHQKDSLTKAREVVGERVEITCSNTPFIG